MGLETSDDAAVYRLTDEIAIINTVDFITPPVDDPYWFGQISAANSISDVYSMGGMPLTALNVVMFPAKHLDLGYLRDILRGGHDKVAEAGACLVGGHMRVGLEDNIRIPNGEMAKGSYEQVELAVKIAAMLGREPATPAEARKILGIKKK